MADLDDLKYQLEYIVRMASERGKFEPLLRLIESDSAAKFAHASLIGLLRDLIRDDRIRPPKRQTGRPKQRKSATADLGEKWPVWLGLNDVKRIKRVWRKRYGRKYRVNVDAIALAAKRRGVNPNQIAAQLRMSRTDPRKL